MKYMRRALVLSIVFLLLVSIPSDFKRTDVKSVETTVLSQGSIPIERDWTANIVVVGYDPALIDEMILLQGMPTVRNYFADDVDITYNIDYEIAYADSTYVDDLRQEMLDNSINGTR